MKTRNISLTLDKAREWYKTGGELKEVALQAFSESELKEFDFRDIKSFDDALRVLGVNYDFVYQYLSTLSEISKAGAAAYKLNIIRIALNDPYKLTLKTNPLYYPIFELKLTATLKRGILNCVNLNGDNYYILDPEIKRNYRGAIYNDLYENKILCSPISASSLGCVTREVAEHLGKYFYKEIFESMFADFVDIRFTK